MPMDCGPPGSSVCGILQARILEWVAIFFSRGSSWPGDKTRVSCISYICRWILYQLSHLGSSRVHAKLLQSCLTFCDPVNCSLPGLSVHGNSPGKNTGVGCHASSRGSSQPRDESCVSCNSFIAGGFFTTEPPGKPNSIGRGLLKAYTLFPLNFTP